MHNFVIATNNQKKLKELSAILDEFNINAKSMKEAGINTEIEEDGLTFEENALIKARTVCKLSGCPAVADDSGLCVEALNGEPGIYSARYGGDKCQNDIDRYELLIYNMKNMENRKAYFVSAVACVFPDGREFTVRGTVDGEILCAPQGENGFGYDPIFYIEQYKKTMAEIEPEIKNKISHRANALKLFVKELEKYI
ncbi:MAG: XTP/dITP diphosphatase [Ruminococcaceae bacterium]|nr:XTP/dITP diphosphatase [Oscillospiraceae bacterium]